MKQIVSLFLLVLFSMSLSAQNITVSGIVKSDKGEPVPLVAVGVKGTTKGVTTDFDGKFSIADVSSDAVLVLSHVEFDIMEFPLNGKSNVDITMKTKLVELEKVVVIGYGSVKKSDVTGSVSSIKAEDIQKVPVASVENALQGQAAGVQVTANSGKPGGGVSVTIRGIGTLGDAKPLYIVDGMSVADVGSINPGDIESIEVLKDASATAIYGSRGANGVIIISTKRGATKKERLDVSLESYYGIQQPWKYLNLANATEWATLHNQALINDDIAAGGTGEGAKAKDAWIPNAESLGEGTNWQREMFQNAPMMSHRVSIAGSGEKSQFTMSSSFYDQEGILPGSDHNRITFRLTNDNQLSDKIRVGTSININNSGGNSLPEQDEWHGPLSAMIMIDPVTPVYDSTGNFASTPYNDSWNPVAILDREVNYWEGLNVIGNAYIEYEFIKGFTYKTNFGVEKANYESTDFNPTYYISPSEQLGINELYRNSSWTDNWNLQNMLTMDKSFNKHNLQATAVYERVREFYFSRNAKITDLPSNDPKDRYLSLGELNPQIKESTWPVNLESVLGRVVYSFNDKYLVTSSLRSDWSSKFEKGFRNIIAPSFSTGWQLHKEPFMQSFIRSKKDPSRNWISSLKIRAGWGQIGNQDFGQASTNPTVTPNKNNYVFGSAYNGVIPTSEATSLQTLNNGDAFYGFKNEKVRWEVSEQVNVGTDMIFYEGKLELNLDYFVRTTKDALMQIPIPDYVGVSDQWTNGSTIQNKGLELALNYRNKINKVIDIKFAPNVSYLKNEVIAMQTENGEEGEMIMGNNFLAQENVSVVTVGHPFASFWGFKTDGIFQSAEEIAAYGLQKSALPGDVKYVDVNGDGLINDNDKTFIGSPWPDFNFGGELSLGYKNWMVSIMGQGVAGNQVYNGMRYYLYKGDGFRNMSADMLDSWTAENGSTEYIQMRTTDKNSPNNYRPSDRYIESGAYFRLKNVTLTYNLPQGVVQKLKITNAQIYVRSQNLMTFTNYSGFDPEIGKDSWNSDGLRIATDRGTYPAARSILAGVKVNF